jgi:hypothetical protein
MPSLPRRTHPMLNEISNAEVRNIQGYADLFHKLIFHYIPKSVEPERMFWGKVAVRIRITL